MNASEREEAQVGPLQGEGRYLLKERAYDALKKSIMSEEFPPGAELAERKLATKLGMSKTPVKAALERLVVEGFVTISPQHCILVRDLTPKEIADQYEARAAMEELIVRNLATNLNVYQTHQLESSLLKQERSLQDGTVEQWIKLDAEFHLLLASLYGNDTIYRFMLGLQDKFHRVISRVFQVKPLRFQDSVVEHRGIVRAIIEGESAKAVRLISEHLENGRKLVSSPSSSGDVPN